MASKTQFISKLGILGLLLMGWQAQALPPIQLGMPRVDGSGCQIGTTQAVVSPDGSAVSILFDRFTTQGRAGGNNSLANLRQYCHFNIPVQIPPGLSLQATAITYRGFANLRDGQAAWLMTTGPIANVPSYKLEPRTPKTRLVNMTENFTVTQTIPAPLSGACQPVSSIDFNTIVQISGGSPRNPNLLTSDAEVTLDTADLISGESEAIRLTFHVVPCH